MEDKNTYMSLIAYITMASLTFAEVDATEKQDNVHTCHNDDESETMVNLSWRLAPEISFSDWSIEVTHQNGTMKCTRVYHVHKCVLAVGSRRSEYFQRLFSNHRFIEHSISLSQVEVHKLAADAFPDMLDYLYNPAETNKFRMTTQNATALSHLSQYFDIKWLRRDVEKFWSHDLDRSTCGLYIEHAYHLKEEIILKAAMDKFSANLSSIQCSKTCRLLHVGDATVLASVLKGAQVSEKASSKYASMFVQQFLVLCIRDQKHVLSVSDFEALTHETVLPTIDARVAVSLLVFDRIVHKHTEQSTALSTLQQRCIKAIVDNWEIFDPVEEQPRLLQLDAITLTAIIRKAHFATKQKRTKNNENTPTQPALESKKRRFWFR